MANGSTQFDVAFFGLQAGQHEVAANEINTRLQQAAADGDWKIAWMVTTSEGIVMVLQRPTPVAPSPMVSTGGYAVGR